MDISNKIAWQSRIGGMIEVLGGLEASGFYDEVADRYHPVYDEVWALAEAFDIDRIELADVLSRGPVARQCWLPENAHHLETMGTTEIYWRLRENLADERWVDGALAEAFETGVLTAALKRLSDELDALAIKGD